mmetsp:Transcript_36787/g.33014  ORF Transcript_36787/g.33014 Transcript_36787/m.33014 type:complete len:122 (+) Transcript_36787:45-410(+)
MQNFKNILRSPSLFGIKCQRFSSYNDVIYKSLADADPEIASIIKQEANRQKTSLCLIASENFTSKSVREAIGSVMCNKYSEGYPGARYYGGNDFIDKAESLCQKRALDAFGLDPEKWGVNV